LAPTVRISRTALTIPMIRKGLQLNPATLEMRHDGAQHFHADDCEEDAVDRGRHSGREDLSRSKQVLISGLSLLGSVTSLEFPRFGGHAGLGVDLLS